jgi:hypothetical protein
VEERFRSAHPVECFVCRRRFVVGRVIATARSNDGVMFCGAVCPECIEGGEERIQRYLEENAQLSRVCAEQDEELLEEGLSEVPRIAFSRVMEHLAALD